MQLGQEDYPIEEGILFLVLLLSLVFNVFLFSRGHGTYSVKYQLMKKHRFFRVNQFATMLVEGLYKGFFVLPFIIIAVIAILRGIKQPVQLLPILVNGLIVILIIYPSHRTAYFLKNAFVWLFAIASQLFTLFLVDANPNESSSFTQISAIFYTANSMVFCLALLNNEKIYWELGQGVQECGEETIKDVNQDWIIRGGIQNLPPVFDGGIYGWMCKKGTYTFFLILYFTSLVILGIYAFLVFLIENSYLGITGLVTNIVYDIFILTFSSLKSNERSISTIFIMVFVGRFLSFVFGVDLWLFGYCILYLLVGVFIGKIIIQRNFPLKFQKPSHQVRTVNAFKTPQFVLLILTVEIFILILVQQLTDVTKVVTINYGDKHIPIWQFAIIIVFLTWVIILYMASVRVMTRHINKIRSLTQYYFGIKNITEYHIYIVLTYLLIVGGGLYCLFALNDRDIFLGCIFLPWIYVLVFQIGISWIKNDFAILADTEEHNRKSFKKYENKLKKINMLKSRRQRQRQKKMNMTGGATFPQFNQTNLAQLNQTNMMQTQNLGFFASVNQNLMKANKKQSKMQKQDDKQYNSNIKIIPSKLIEDESAHNQDSKTDIFRVQEDQKQTPKLEDFIELKDWRNMKDISYIEIWSNLTKFDKDIIVFSLITIAIFITYSIVAGVWADSTSGLGFSISIISFMTSFVYYKVAKSGNPSSLSEIVIAVLGFSMGLILWAVKYQTVFAGVLWALVLVLLYSLSLSSGIQKKIQTYLLAMLGIKIILLLIFICILLGASYGVAVGIVCLAVIVAIALGLFNFYHLQKNGFIPQVLKIVTVVSLVSMVIGIAIAGFLLDVVSDFAVFTIIVFFIFLGFLAVSTLIHLAKYNNRYNHPHVYSCYGEPIYRFETDTEKLKSSMNHVILFQISTIILVVYAAVTTLFFKEKYMSIYALALFLIMQFMDIILRSIETYYYLGENKQFLTRNLILEAFNKVRDKYMLNQTQGEDSPYYLKKFEDSKKEAQQASDQQKLNTLWKEVVQNKEQCIKNLQQEEKFLFFWLALIRLHIYSDKKNRMVQFVRQIQQIQEQLIQKGILIQSINSPQNVDIKFKLIQKEIGQLAPWDFIIYEEIYNKQKNQNKKKKKELAKLHQQSQAIIQNKQQELFKKKFEQLAQEKEVNKIQQFKQLITSLGKGQFSDSEFPPNQTSLGNQSTKVKSWRRPEMQEKFICGEGMTPDDVKQGNIGDCYLISSFAVLGQQFLKKSIGYQGGKQLWTNSKGAYMIKFYKFLKQVYVIVDDHLPVDQNGKLVFARSQEKGQIWPAILQKAYAKLYNGYDKIVSGKCHQVLSQFTGGFPFQILLNQYKSNPNSLWTKIISGKQHGYLLAAGSPENKQGDSVSSKRGIVQGHAYSILDVKQIDDYKLIKLKNPHGTGGMEWKGDFSDNSPYMTKAMRNRLSHSKENDGIFWMKLEDFIDEFKSLYICCIFEENWKKLDPIEGRWTINNSFGRPDQSQNSHKNIQFGIRVEKKCTLFISLSQQHQTALTGKNFINMRIQRNDGKRMQKTDVTSDRLCGAPTKPINLVTISEQIQLQNSSYPYTFTLYISSQTKDNKRGQGTFKLQIYCDDVSISVIPDQQFDRETYNKQ